MVYQQAEMIRGYLDTIGKDKYMHFGACAALSWLVARIGLALGLQSPFAQMLGFGAGVIVGFGKELYDRYGRKGTFDWLDIKADVFGSFAGAAMSL